MRVDDFDIESFRSIVFITIADQCSEAIENWLVVVVVFPGRDQHKNQRSSLRWDHVVQCSHSLRRWLSSRHSCLPLYRGDGRPHKSYFPGCRLSDRRLKTSVLDAVWYWKHRRGKPRCCSVGLKLEMTKWVRHIDEVYWLRYPMEFFAVRASLKGH